MVKAFVFYKNGTVKAFETKAHLLFTIGSPQLKDAVRILIYRKRKLIGEIDVESND